MVATLWIHRLIGQDILVYFGSRKDAHDFAIDFLESHGDNSEELYTWDYVTMDPYNDCHYLPECENLQLSIHDGRFFHAGWMEVAGWAPKGTLLVSHEEAMVMGKEQCPPDFILDTSTVNSYPWMRSAKVIEPAYYMRRAK